MTGRLLPFAVASLCNLLLIVVGHDASAQTPTADLGFTSVRASATSSLATVTADVANDGPSEAQTPTLTFTLPIGLTLASGSVATADTCTFETNTRTVTCGWPSPPVAPGTSTSAVVTLTNIGLPVGSQVGIEARISSTTPDPNPSNNTVSVTVTLLGGPVPTVPGGASADLELTVIEPTAAPPPGTALLLWDVTNLGLTPAQDVVVTFTLPASVKLLSGNVATFACTTGPATRVACPYGRTLNPSQAVRAALELDISDVPRGTEVSVQASVASSTPDPNQANNVSTSMIQVPGGASPTSAPAQLVPTGSGPFPLILAIALLMVGVALLAASRWASRRPSSATST